MHPKNINLKLKKLYIYISVSILILNLYFLFLYITNYYKYQFHSDSAVKVLLAKEIYECVCIFPESWVYANGDIWLLFGHLIIAPMLFFVPAGFGVHAAAGLVVSAIILHATWMTTSLAPISLARRILIVAIMAAGISSFSAENLYGQTSYGAVLAHSLYLIVFSARLLDSTRKVWPWAAALLVLMAFGFWANPQRAALSYFLPLLCGLVWIACLGPTCAVRDPSRKRLLLVFAAAFCGSVIGALFNYLTLANVTVTDGVSVVHFLTYDRFLHNLSQLPRSWLVILGGELSPDVSLASLEGFYSALRFGVAVLVAGMVFALARKAISSQMIEAPLLSIFGLSVLMMSGFIFVTTTVPDMSLPVASSRYLFPGVVLCLLAVLLQPIFCRINLVRGRIILTISAVLSTAAYISYNNNPHSNTRSWYQPAIENHMDVNSIISVLKENNLEYGYASFWNAGIISVLSNEKALVRQVIMHNGLPHPMLHLASKAWFERDSWNGPTFLLLSNDEVKLLDLNKLASFDRKPAKVIKAGGFEIFVFENNALESLPNWTQTLGLPSG